MLLNRSWTDEEHRSLSASYQTKLDELQRQVAILTAVSEHIGPGLDYAVLQTIHSMALHLPTMFYDRQGPAGMVFVATVFDHRLLAEGFEAVRASMSDIGAKHRLHLDGIDAGRGFEIIRHLDNNWWGRRPVRCEAYPNEFAASLIERYPAPVDGDRDPALIVDDGQVWQKTTFRQYTDQEARSYKDSAYQVAPDWTVISAGADAPHTVEFSVADWIRQSENIKGVDRLWYLCRYEPAQEW